MKRTYKQVTVERIAEGFAVLLDQKSACTPLGAAIVLPTKLLAQAVGDEWQAQGETIDKDSMLLTHIACVALDLIHAQRDTAINDVLPYAQTDLICYRAGHIPLLAKRQAEALNPIVAWVHERFAIELTITDGVMPVSQPLSNHGKLKTVLSGYDDWMLAVFLSITKSMGSIILALALCEGRIDAVQAFEYSHLEEIYETEQWKKDEEKEKKMQRIKDEVVAAQRFLFCLPEGGFYHSQKVALNA